MVAPQPTAPSGNQPPPDLPNLEKTENNLVNYLRAFSLWCRQGFVAKLDAKTALPGVILQTNDTPPGVTPKVYLVGVNSTPNLTLSQMKLGDDSGGGGRVIAGSNTFLPLVGGTLSGKLTLNAGMNFFNATGASPTDLSKHIDLYNGTYGFSITGGTLNIVSQSVAAIQCAAGTATVPGTLNVGGNLGTNTISGNGSQVFYQPPQVIGQAGQSSFMLQGNGGGNHAMMTFHCPGQFANNFGLHTNSYFYFGGWSLGANYYQNWTSRDFANPASDYRIKKGVKPLSSTWDQVKALRPISYSHREFKLPHRSMRDTTPQVLANDTEHWGFIAHELQEILLPTVSTGVKDDPLLIQSPTMLPLVAALTKTIQELQARVEALES